MDGSAEELLWFDKLTTNGVRGYGQASQKESFLRGTS
jgi:hypothetical protein